MTDRPAADDAAAVSSLLEKMRQFAVDLDPAERRVLAALLAPGVAAAWAEEPEVAGFTWRPADLDDHLAAAVRAHGLRIVGW